MSVEAIIRKLDLKPLPEEGGWFRRTRTEECAEGRALMSCIYALFTADQFSALHRLDASETLFYQSGDPFEILALGPDRKVESLILGPKLDSGHQPQLTFPAGTWFGGRPLDRGEHGYSLMSAVVSPGFEWDGFELGRRDLLIDDFPGHESEIELLTREVGG